MSWQLCTRVVTNKNKEKLAKKEKSSNLYNMVAEMYLRGLILL